MKQSQELKKERLETLYWNGEMSLREVANECKCGLKTRHKEQYGRELESQLKRH